MNGDALGDDAQVDAPDTLLGQDTGLSAGPPQAGGRFAVAEGSREGRAVEGRGEVVVALVEVDGATRRAEGIGAGRGNAAR
ncbi:MAG: hypothetical protein HRU01_05585 [Myxococcales bacterium]|nr:hypothetical protein [Myxococcales bacterium]